MAAVPAVGDDTRLLPAHRSLVERMARARPVQIAAILLALVAASIWATRSAQIAFTLRVDGSQATLSADGQSIGAPWPGGAVHAQPQSSPEHARLFAVDGTDSAGTLSEDSSTLGSEMSTAYYRFVCWVRDCGGYSRWQELSLRDDASGVQLLESGTPDALSAVALPRRFTLSGTLQRPDVSSTITFAGASGAQITINVDGRSLVLNSQSIYYPHDWRPYLAEVGWTLTRACLWALALLALIVVFSALLAASAAHAPIARFRGLAARLAGIPPRAVSLIGVGILLTVLLTISSVTYQRLPRVFDGISYYFQASILRSGHLTIATPPAVGYFPGPFMVNSNGHWFSHFPPGAPLAIALGMLVNLPWAVEPLLGVASALMIGDLARRWYGTSTMVLSLALLGLSPFYLFLASSYLSHTVALCALLLLLEGVDRLCASGDWRWAAVAGAGLGYAVLSREIASVLFALPLVLFYGVRAAPHLPRWLSSGRPAWLRAAAIGGGLTTPLAVCGAFYLFYNWRLTGNPTLTPRVVFDARDTWGFGTGKGWYNMHSVAAGLFVVENQLTSLLTHLFGWPYYLTLSFFFLPLLTLHLRPYDLLLYGIAGTFLLGYVGYFYHGIAFGPRYLFESLPAYILLTARGVHTAAALAARFLERSVGPPLARIGGTGGALAALALLCACNLAFYLPRQTSLYYDYLEHRAAGGLGYDRIHPSWMHHAIVLNDDFGFYGDVLFPLNDPLLQGDVLYGFVNGDRNLNGLLAAYPGRSLYWISAPNQQLQFRPLHIGPSGRPLSLPPTGAQPYSALALGPAGDLYLASPSDGTIRQVSATGALTATLASGVPPGMGFGVQVAHEALYWLNPADGAMWMAGTASAAVRRLLFHCQCGPRSVFTVDAAGRTAVADPDTGVIRRFGADGRPLDRIPQIGQVSPAAVASTADGTLFVYDQTTHSVLRYDSGARRYRALAFGQQPDGSLVHLVSAGNWLVLSDPSNARLIAYDALTGAQRDMALTADGLLLPSQPWGLAWDGRTLAVAGGQPGSAVRMTSGTPPF